MRRLAPLTSILAVALLVTASPTPARAGDAASAAAPAVDPAYAQDVAHWRSERDEGLRKPDGWLTLVGLYWLHDGDNSFGSAAGNDLVFPAGTPPKIGTFHLADGKVSVRAEPGAGLTHDGEPVTEMALDADVSEHATVLALGTLTFYVIERPGHIGIRAKDSASPALAEFKGIEDFPIDPTWRITARFEPYDPPKKVRIPNVIGTEFAETCPGAAVFEVDGKTYRLEPTGDPAEGLGLVFGDATNGHETYGGGRFLGIDPPVDGHLVLDFNKAYNPPCVFTPFATCPLPPRQNRLPIRVAAGEKVYGHPAH
jgi:uncharacterized protein